MYPYYGGYKSDFKLPQDDINRIQALYGKHPTGKSTAAPPSGQPTQAPTTGRQTLPQTTAPPCRDTSNQCTTIEMKYCRDVSKSWEDWMRKYCPNKCGFCGGGGPTTGRPTLPPTTQRPTTQPTKRPTPGPTKYPLPNPCRDMTSSCNGFDKNKHCTNMGDNWENWMRRYCANFCGFCGASPSEQPTQAPTTAPSCRDTSNQCPTIEMKYCRDVSTSWEDWMRRNCPKKCGFCGGSE